MTRLDYLTMGRMIYTFTKLVKLQSMYEPLGYTLIENARDHVEDVVSNSKPKLAVNKHMRLVIRMSGFNYSVEHSP